jgi:hypothetical protein
MPPRVRLVDRAGAHVCWLDRDAAKRLLARGEVEALRTRRRVRAVRWVMPEPHEEPRRLYVLRRRGYGDSHRRETPENPRGVWTIDRIAPSHRALFLTVLAERLAA